MLTLRHGRTIDIDAGGTDDVLEIRDPSGLVELRVKLTEDGVILQLEGTRISLKAAESVDVECKTFTVHSEQSVHVQGGGDVYIQGKLVHLN